MAKISAYGATKVETITSVIDGTKYVHTLNSRGCIFRRSEFDPVNKQVAKISVSAPDQRATFRAYVRRFVAARS